MSVHHGNFPRLRGTPMDNHLVSAVGEVVCNIRSVREIVRGALFDGVLLVPAQIINSLKPWWLQSFMTRQRIGIPQIYYPNMEEPIRRLTAIPHRCSRAPASPADIRIGNGCREGLMYVHVFKEPLNKSCADWRANFCQVKMRNRRNTLCISRFPDKIWR